MEIRNGELVYYAGCVLYFQSSGIYCYLYENVEDVGKRHKAIFSPSISSVIYPVPRGIEKIPSGLKPMKRLSDYEYLKTRVDDILLGGESDTL